MMTTKDDNVCPTCTKDVLRSEQALQCDLCNIWYHIKCQGVSSEVYKILSKKCNNYIHWFCKLCNANAITTIRLIQEVKADVESTRKTVESLSSELTALKLSYADIVARLSQLEKQKSNGCNEEMERKFESFDIYKRKKNLILFNIPEIDEVDDKSAVIDVLRELSLESTKFDVIGRIGQKSNRTRPLRITTDSYTNRSEVLSKAKELKTSADLKHVYINSDLTKLQQLSARKLRDELRKKREEGLTNLGIRRGKIVSLQS